MTKIRVKNLLIVVVLFPVFLFSQKNDFQTWSSLELVYKDIKKTEFIFETGIRLTDNSKIVSKYFTDISIKRDYNKLLSYSIGYRPIFDKNNDLVFEKKNRYYGDVFFKKSISKRVKFSFRTRFQSQIDSESEFSRNIKNKLRQKVKCTYDINNTNLDVFCASEVFYLINNGFEKLRYVMGFEKPFTKKIDLNINCMIQQEVNNPINKLWFVTRFKLCYEI